MSNSQRIKYYRCIIGQGEYVISYKLLRKAVGVIGVALPMLLVTAKYILEGPGIQSSLSGYYYTVMRDVFVGSLWAIAIFLMAYNGPDKKDDLAGNFACLFAIGLSVFPTSPDTEVSSYERIIGFLHLGFVAGFFLVLAYFCLVLFCKTAPDKRPTGRKMLRNRVYRVCGYTIIGCILLICLVAILPETSSVRNIDPVFWLESFAIWAFGWSWFIKGEALLKDLTA